MEPVIDYRTNEGERITLRPGRQGAIYVGEFAIGPEYVALIDGSRLVNIISRADVQLIHVRYGFLARHPVLMLAISIFLILVTLVGLIALGLPSLGLRVPAKGFIYMLANIVLVPFCLRAATQRGYYLDVKTPRGVVRLAPEQRTRKIEAIEAACSIAEQFGYTVVRDPNLPANG